MIRQIISYILMKNDINERLHIDFVITFVQINYQMDNRLIGFR